MKNYGEPQTNPNEVSANKGHSAQLEGWLALFQTPWKWRGLA